MPSSTITDNSPKVFVLGHVNGQLETAFKKLTILHAKNNFSCAIATGNLFGPDEDAESTDEQVTKLLAGEITIPVSTYFTVGTRPLPPRIVAKIEQEEDVCENLHYLGKRSVTKTSDGIRIVALGGLLDNGSDISAVAVWPKDIWRGSGVALPNGLSTAQIPASDGLADLVVALRPRYVLTASPLPAKDGDDKDFASCFFYEREGFFHPERPDETHSLAIDVTRFISLAAVGNTAKAKAMYAFALSAEAPTLVPAGCTPSPYLHRGAASLKRAPLEPGPFSRFGDGNNGRHSRKRARNGDQPRAPPPGPDKCYFCLSNPNLPTHMVCSIGNDAYLATAKGPLPLSTTFSEQGLDFPGHMIVVPLSHSPKLTAEAMQSKDTPDGQAVATSTFREMTRFREGLQAMVAARTKQRLGTVTWEISRLRNVHLHWQVMPVAADLVHRGLVEAAFRVEAENLKLPRLEEVTTPGEIEGDYFRVWIWAEEPDTAEDKAVGDDDGVAGGRIVGKTLVMRLHEGDWFDLQYGRKVLAKLMGLEKRMVWQDTVQTDEEEKTDVAAFRKAFTKWDFTLQE
ncbi:cwf19-like protein [Grosmannia clavigera kw1407]|uniref:Cwf19-like protein n=1 Tax=Grosmannia clavigera (strain kw1407 / UAMH 11150) TaxID=655863 RepID=F0XS14_GROCL|nr:cwf19-like protein [Grosmannia clavigera kw1407]EFW99585.1 cwf19-like protein [Grosmannia clavigera kw1407]